MPESFEGKIQMAHIEQKLTDHITTQNSDMAEIKSGVTRIETKLDVKADKDAIEKVADTLKYKADKDQLDKLDARFWAILMVVIATVLGLIATALKTFIGRI